MKLQLLHVDDDESIRALIEMAFSLAAEGEVRSAASGAAALEMLESGYRPDVMLLDVMMPEMDGPGVLGRVRALPGHGKTPVIFMTARARTQEHERLMAMGAIGVVTKPFDPLTLASVIRSMFDGQKS